MLDIEVYNLLNDNKDRYKNERMIFIKKIINNMNSSITKFINIFVTKHFFQIISLQFSVHTLPLESLFPLLSVVSISPYFLPILALLMSVNTGCRNFLEVRWILSLNVEFIWPFPQCFSKEWRYSFQEKQFYHHKNIFFLLTPCYVF